MAGMASLGMGVATRPEAFGHANFVRGCRDVGLMVLALGAAGLPALALAAWRWALPTSPRPSPPWCSPPSARGASSWR